MNVQNVTLAVGLMEYAALQHTLDMTEFQTGPGALSLDELHDCGNRACLMGHIYLHPEWRKFWKVAFGDGVGLSHDGSVGNETSGLHNTSALARFFGITPDTAGHLMFGDWCTPGIGFYPVPLDRVEPRHVIEKLNAILSGELR